MAFLREYDFRESEDVLVEFFYVDAKYRHPSLIIRMNVRTKEFHCTPLPWLSRVYICDEIRRLFDLLDQPHWKSFVKTCSFGHRFKDQSLL